MLAAIHIRLFIGFYFLLRSIHLVDFRNFTVIVIVSPLIVKLVPRGNAVRPIETVAAQVKALDKLVSGRAAGSSNIDDEGSDEDLGDEI